MRYLLLFWILLAANLSEAQEDPMKNWELSFLTGYNSPLGYFGAKLGYRPNCFDRYVQFTVGSGHNRFRGVMFSAGANCYPFQARTLNPYFGFDYSFSFSNIIASDDGSEFYEVGFNNYINPFLALKINTKSDQLSFKFKAGYTSLLNSPNASMSRGNIETFNDIVDYLKGGYFFTIGISSLFVKSNK